jgi:hypothetical protein
LSSTFLIFISPGRGRFGVRHRRKDCTHHVVGDLALDQTQAFPHADEPESRLAIDRTGVEAFAIVGNSYL